MKVPSIENWEEYDPTWVIKLMEEQMPDEIQVIKNLQRCVLCFWVSKAYVYFVNPDNANQENAEWQFQDNFILLDEEKGEIVLDIINNNRVGGIEFLKYL